MDFLCSLLLVKTYGGESLIIYSDSGNQNWGAQERIETRCLVQSGKLKPQSSEVFEIHIQVFSWLNYSSRLELCNFYFSFCLLYTLIIEDTCVNCGEGNNFGIVKFVRELSGCCSFYLHLQLLSQDCKELTLVWLCWRFLLNCIKH